MQKIPKTIHPIILRTDFSNQEVWEKICEAIRQPVNSFFAYIEFVDGIEYADMDKEQILKLIPNHYNHTFILVADQIAISHPEHPILVIDLYEELGREFRSIPIQIQGIENNLSIANMDFKEFADSVDEDGVFRGFPNN